LARRLVVVPEQVPARAPEQQVRVAGQQDLSTRSWRVEGCLRALAQPERVH